MNRLEEGHIRAIGSSFYQNVFLLTQMVPPFIEFQQHFRQMKNFLSILSRDNPDINFPSILMSHLIQSGGIKFLIIMWKLSQVALKSYIKREIQGELCNAPRSKSLMDDVTVAYFNNATAKRCSIITETRKETQKILDTATSFFKNEIEILNMYKSEIFDRKENIERLALNTPFHPLIKKRLIDVEDINIISSLRKDIREKIQYIYRKNEELIKLGESCNCLCKLVLRISTNSEMLDANKLPKINCNNFLLEANIRIYLKDMQKKIVHLTSLLQHY